MRRALPAVREEAPHARIQRDFELLQSAPGELGRQIREPRILPARAGRIRRDAGGRRDRDARAPGGVAGRERGPDRGHNQQDAPPRGREDGARELAETPGPLSARQRGVVDHAPTMADQKRNRSKPKG